MHFNPDKKPWDIPTESPLHLVMVSEGMDQPDDTLSAQVTFKVPRWEYEGTVRSTAPKSQWTRGVAPTDFDQLLKWTAEESKLQQRLVASSGSSAKGASGPADESEEFTVEVEVQLLEHARFAGPSLVIFVLHDFEQLRAASAAEPCQAGFLSSLRRRFVVVGPGYGRLTFQAQVFPNIDATGNLYVSFKLERADSRLTSLQLHYEISFEEALPDPGLFAGGTSRSFSMKSETIGGSVFDFQKTLGLAGLPTDFPPLRKHVGTVTLKLEVCVAGFAMEDTLRGLPSRMSPWGSELELSRPTTRDKAGSAQYSELSTEASWSPKGTFSRGGEDWSPARSTRNVDFELGDTLPKTAPADSSRLQNL